MRIAVRRLLPALVLALAAPCLAPARPAAAGPLERRAAALVAGLATRRVRGVKFDQAPVDEVVGWLRLATGWNFVVRRAVIAKAGIDLDTIRTTLDLDDVTVGTVLEVVFGPHGLVAKAEGNIVYVTTRADALGPPVLALYPISQLTWQKIDFHGPDIDLHPSDFTPPEHVDESPVEDDPFLDPQHVVDLVKEMVDAPWDTEGWSLRATKQFLMVRAPRAVQREVADAVERMSALK
jgi:hypothetical protein